MPSNERLPYEGRSIQELQQECQERGYTRKGLKQTLVARLVNDDRNKHLQATVPSFNGTNDPLGARMARHIRDETAFETRCITSIHLSEVEHYESLAQGKRDDLAEALKGLQLSESKKLAANELEVKSYNDRNVKDLPDQVRKTDAASPSETTGPEILSGGILNPICIDSDDEAPTASELVDSDLSNLTNSGVKRSISSSDDKNSALDAAKKVRTSGPAQAASLGNITKEPGNQPEEIKIESINLEDELAKRGKTFVMIRAYLRQDAELIRGIQKHLAEYEPEEVRADKTATYVIFDAKATKPHTRRYSYHALFGWLGAVLGNPKSEYLPDIDIAYCYVEGKSLDVCHTRRPNMDGHN